MRFITVEGFHVRGTDSEATAVALAKNGDVIRTIVLIDCEQRKEIIGYAECEGFIYSETGPQDYLKEQP